MDLLFEHHADWNAIALDSHCAHADLNAVALDAQCGSWRPCRFARRPFRCFSRVLTRSSYLDEGWSKKDGVLRDRLRIVDILYNVWHRV